MYHVVNQNDDDVAGATVNANEESGTTGSDGRTSISGIDIDENNYSEPLETLVEYTVSGSDLSGGSGSHNINSGNNPEKDITVNQILNYTRNITFNLASDEAGEGHIVRDSPIAISYSGDNQTKTTSSQTATFTVTTSETNPTINYTIDVNGEGHNDKSGNFTISTSDANRTITLNANDFTGDVTYHVTNQNSEDVSGAGIATSQNKNGTTGSDGRLTLYDYVIDENTYSEPISTNNEYTISKEGIVTKTGTHNINTGTNSLEETVEEEAQGQEYTMQFRYISINGSDFINGELKVQSSYGTYTSSSSGSNGSITFTADPDETVQLYGNVSGYENNFISVVGIDSKTGSGPAQADPDNLDDSRLDVILGRSDIVNNPTWQSTLSSPGGFHRGGTLDLEVYNWNEETQAPAGSEFTDAQSTALSYVPGACNFGIYGSVVTFSGSPTVIEGEPTSSSGKVLIYTDTRFSYTNSPNSGMDGTVVVVGGTNVTSTFVESMEWLTGQGGEGYFFSGTSLTEAGESKLTYTRKFGY